jgi:competence protein ComFC
MLSIIYPAFCPICNQALSRPCKSTICPACWENITLIQPPICSVCGLPLNAAPDIAQSIELMCADCRKRRRPFTAARALGIYEYELRDIILLLKFKGKSKLAEELGTLALNKLRNNKLIDGVDAIVPVPLYWQRKRKRGFNQAELLAGYLGKQLELPLLSGYLRRIKNTPPQSQVDAKERAKNVRGAFKVREPWWRIAKGLLQIVMDRIKGKLVKKWSLSTPTNYLKGKVILLVDDIFTTGATVSECARTLKKAGAKEVRIFTIARA